MTMTRPSPSKTTGIFSRAWFMEAALVHRPVSGSQISVTLVLFRSKVAPPAATTRPSARVTAAGRSLGRLIDSVRTHSSAAGSKISTVER